MDKLSHLLQRVLHRRGIHGEASAAHVVYLANRWINTKLPEISASVHAVSLQNGVLTVECEHSIAAQEMQNVSETMQDYLNGASDLRVSRIMLLRARSSSNC